jgi:hypothetical protein
MSFGFGFAFTRLFGLSGSDVLSSNLETESGDNFLLEDGFYLLLE